MKAFLKALWRDTPKIILYSLILPVLELLIFVFNYLPQANKLCALEFPVFAATFGIILISILLLLVSLAFLVRLCFIRKYNLEAFLAIIFILNFALLFVFRTPEEKLQNQAILRVTQIYQPVIDSLEKYKQKNGDYPSSLDQLVPDYLTNLPGPYSCALPAAEYKNESSWGETQYLTGGYRLMIFIAPLEGIFYYLPNQNYSSCEKENDCKKVNGWVWKFD